jgi:hypothetical protein
MQSDYYILSSYFTNNIALFYYRHIPKAKATTVAETPELKRIAENTKIQSNVSYTVIHCHYTITS